MTKWSMSHPLKGGKISFRKQCKACYPVGPDLPEFYSVKYAFFNNAISIIKAYDSGPLMAKCNIQSPFRLLPVHPLEFCMMGFKLNGTRYTVKAMPMECSESWAAYMIFKAFSIHWEWTMKDTMGNPFVALQL